MKRWLWDASLISACGRMARKRSSGRTKRSAKSGFAKVFFIANLIVWGAIGGWYLFQPPERKTEISRLVGNWIEGRKNVTAFDVAWDLWQIYGSGDFVDGAAAISNGGDDFAYAGWPESSRAVRLLKNEGYIAGYSDVMGNPLWVAYRMKDVETLEAPKRPEEFRVDPRTTARVEPSDYTRSGYDRGHLAPNYAIATRYGKAAQEETFLMSNIVPQRHALNAGLWKALEQKIATNYAARFEEVWVVAGPVFGEKPAWLRRRVAVPEGFFMIVVDESEGRVRAQAFLFPQEIPEGAGLADYARSIDEIESRTGLDFLSELPDEVESALEAKRVSRVW